MISKDNIRISVTIPSKLHELLLQEAGIEDRSVSNLVAKIIKQHYGQKLDEED